MLCICLLVLAVVNSDIFLSKLIVVCEVKQSLTSDCDHMSVLQVHIRKCAPTHTAIDNSVRAKVVKGLECDVHCKTVINNILSNCLFAYPTVWRRVVFKDPLVS